MDLCNKILSKAPTSWLDVQKQLLNVIQTRANMATTTQSATSINVNASSTLAINKLFVKQCTDFLIKHIKNLNQTQVIDHLENLAQSSGLMVYKMPSEDDPTTTNAFLNTDDFYFEVSINSRGEITEVKFSICSEPAKSSSLLKEIFCSWNWNLLSKHIEGIKSNFILKDPDHQIRTKGFKSIQCLEKDLNSLYKIQVKYLEKILKTSLNSKANDIQMKYMDKLLNQTPIGVLKKSELGQPMRLYYYLSPLDLIQHHSKDYNLNDINAKHNLFSSLSIDQLIKYEIGSYVSISLESSRKNDTIKVESSNEDTFQHKLPDTTLLVLNENDDENNWHDLLHPYFNINLNFDKNPLFKKINKTKVNSLNNPSINTPTSNNQVPGTYIAKLSKPIVMCLSTLNQLQTQIGIETISVESLYKSEKLTPFFEILAKTSISNKVLNDAYSVQLPDENQVYYITELDQVSSMGVVVDELLFVHPQDLVIILETLRKQLLFNELLLSCMRKLCSSAMSISCNNNNYDLNNYNFSNGKTNSRSNNVRILEIGLLEPFIVSIIMQHPKLLCYTTIEIDVSKGNIETRFRDHNDLHNPNVISEIIRRCHSIPVTIRALLMKYRQTSSITSKRKVNLNNNNSGNSDSNGNSYATAPTNDSNNLFYSNNTTNNNSSSNPNPSSNNNGNKNNYDNSQNNYHRNFKSESSESSQEEEFHITPRSFLGNETPRRLTPSRRDSYNRNSSSSSNTNSANSVKTPNSVSTSIFNFSNLINDQKQLQQKKINEEALLMQASAFKNHSFADELKIKLKSEMNIEEKVFDSVISESNDKISLKQLKSQISSESPMAQMSATSSTTPSSSTIPLNLSSSTTSTKKRKASSSSSNSESLPSTPVPPQQPSAKRKMTNQQHSANDSKKNVSLIDDETNKTSNSKSDAKKNKLKSSLSSNSLTSGNSSSSTGSNGNNSSLKSSENKKLNNIHDVKSTGANLLNSSSKSEKSIKKSVEGVLTTLINTNTGSITNSSNTNKIKSSSNPSKANSTNKKVSVSSPPVTANSAALKPNTSSNQMRAKPITEDGLKIRISKDPNTKLSSQRSTSSSSFVSSPNNLLQNKNNMNIQNLSATEIQLKQPNNSLNTPPTTTLNSNGSSNLSTPASAIQQIQSSCSTRTPSPSSFALLSIQPASGIPNTPNIPNDLETNVENETSQTQPTTKNEQVKVKNKIAKPSLNLSTLLSSNSSKSNTPPSQSPSLASSLGLGTTFKASNFKIPHKAKTSDNSDSADEIKTPLTSSSPIPTNTNNTSNTSNSTSRPTNLGSPNKSNSSSVNLDTKNPIPKNSTAINRSNSANSRSNASPKWQPSYSGNMSPRYINSFDSNVSTSPSSISPLQAPPPPPPLQSQQTSNKHNKNNMPLNRSQSLNSTRPVTPIPSQFAQSNGIPNRSHYHSITNTNPNANKTLLPLPTSLPLHLQTPIPTTPPLIQSSLQTTSTTAPTTSKSILPLMSYSSSSNKSNLMTPLSPSNEISQISDTKSNKLEDTVNMCSSPSLPHPPDSPVCETAPMVIPKLIPLERNISNSNTISIPTETITTQTIPLTNANQVNKNGSTSVDSKLKSDAVDIASPDAYVDNEEDNDNLVIDLIQNSTTMISAHRTSKGNSGFNLNEFAAIISNKKSFSNTNEIMSVSSTLSQTTIIPQHNARIDIRSPSPCVGLDEDLINEPAMIS